MTHTQEYKTLHGGELTVTAWKELERLWIQNRLGETFEFYNDQDEYRTWLLEVIQEENLSVYEIAHLHQALKMELVKTSVQHYILLTLNRLRSALFMCAPQPSSETYVHLEDIKLIRETLQIAGLKQINEMDKESS